MRIKAILTTTIILLLMISCSSKTRDFIEPISYPSFGAEIEVTINGLSFDSMEPFISSDGNYLFFNNLNDGINTKLFYSTKINDSIFNYAGELTGTNQSTDHI
jgi:hypothetical protein